MVSGSIPAPYTHDYTSIMAFWWIHGVINVRLFYNSFGFIAIASDIKA